jgi:thiamine-monophosphate kinase
LQGGLPELAAEHRAALARRYQLPDPRTSLGPRLVGIAHAMCDVSDGLLGDLGHICDASGCGATVRLPALPLSAAARAVAEQQPESAPDLATGGDDYELLFAAGRADHGAVLSLAAELGVPITCIGVIDAEERVRLIGADDTEIAVRISGYRHF